MNLFLPVFLLLGVATTLIPSASGLRCVHCKFSKKTGFLGGYSSSSYGSENCEDYKKHSSSASEYEKACPEPSDERTKKSVCIASSNKVDNTKTDSSGCGEVGADVKLGCTKCKGPAGRGEICICDTDLCNRSPRMNKKGAPGLVMFLGGVGLIWGQIGG